MSVEQVGGQKKYIEPQTVIGELSDQARSYLHSRGLTDDSIAAYRLGCTADGTIAIPFYDETGKLQLVKFRHPEGGKLQLGDREVKTFIEPGGKPVLFGSNLAHNSAGPLVICFGDYDALALYQSGVANVVSLPFGDKGFDFFKFQWDFLDSFAEVILFPDMDDYHTPEAEARAKEKLEELAKRLGVHRTKIVRDADRKGAKDPNDLLIQQGADACLNAIENAIDFPVDGLVKVADHIDEDFKVGRKTGFEFLDVTTGGFGPGDLVIIGGENGAGKALDLSTPLPTPDGWTTMGEVKVGDQLLDESGRPCNVITTSPIMTGHDCFKVVFSDGSEIIADGDHLWLSHTHAARFSQKKAERNNRLDMSKPPKPPFGREQRHKRILPQIVTTREISQSLKITAGTTNHAVKVVQPLDLPERNLPIEPYTLGVWLGDGNSDSGRVSNPDPEIRHEVERDGYSTTQHKDPLNWGILKLLPTLASCGLKGNKHIPAEYLRASYSQRLALLQGLMDTDGTIDQNGRCEFCVTRKSLAEDVHSLILTFGIIANLHETDAVLNGRVVGKRYRIHFSPSIKIFRLPRKAERLNLKRQNDRRTHRYIVDCIPVKSVPVRCVGVDSDSHLFLAGKTLIPTHNTTTVLNMIAASVDLRVPVLNWSGEQRVGRLRYWFERIVAGPGNLKHVQQKDTGFTYYFPHDEFRPFIRDWYRDFFYQYTDFFTNAEKFFSVAEVAIRRYGCGLIVIDNLMAFTGGEGEGYYQAQGDFVQSCKMFAEKWAVTVILIAHNRKDQKKATLQIDIPTKDDLEGSKKISNWADVVLQLYRVPRKLKVDDWRMVDGVISLCKSRETGMLGEIKTIVDAESNRIIDQSREEQLKANYGWYEDYKNRSLYSSQG